MEVLPRLDGARLRVIEESLQQAVAAVELHAGAGASGTRHDIGASSRMHRIRLPDVHVAQVPVFLEILPLLRPPRRHPGAREHEAMHMQQHECAGIRLYQYQTDSATHVSYPYSLTPCSPV